jgi:hypothetical protein
MKRERKGGIVLEMQAACGGVEQRLEYGRPDNNEASYFYH